MNDEPPALRKIIHVDMDAFFASVEQRDNPDLRGKPVAVGGSGPRGVVAAASYEARKFGVRSAMPSSTARRLCPDLIFVRGRFDAYRAASAQIRAIFAEHTDLIEPLSLDEAYLDVSGADNATHIAEQIRARIFAETGLTASAGVSCNKFLAKLASDQNKPNGLCVIRPAQAEAFVAGLKVSRFHGVGPVTARKMERLGIITGADLRAQSLSFLEHHFGSSGQRFHDLARGICHRRVSNDHVRKSLGAEDTFENDLSEEPALAAELERISQIVWERASPKELSARTVTLKIKYRDFRIATRARSVAGGIHSREQMLGIALELLHGLFPLRAGVRLAGLTLSNFEARAEAPPQLALPI